MQSTTRPDSRRTPGLYSGRPVRKACIYRRNQGVEKSRNRDKRMFCEVERARTSRLLPRLLPRPLRPLPRPLGPLARYLAPAIGRLLSAPPARRPRPPPSCCNRSRGYIAACRLAHRRFRECSHGVGRWNFACYHRHRPEAGVTRPARAAFGPLGRRRPAWFGYQHGLVCELSSPVWSSTAARQLGSVAAWLSGSVWPGPAWRPAPARLPAGPAVRSPPALARSARWPGPVRRLGPVAQFGSAMRSGLAARWSLLVARTAAGPLAVPLA